MTLKKSSVDLVAPSTSPDVSPAAIRPADRKLSQSGDGDEDLKEPPSQHWPFPAITRMMLKAVACLICLWLSWPVAPTIAACKSGCYDILYFTHHNFEQVLKYKKKLKAVLGPKKGKKLIIVSTDQQYGLIHKQHASAFSIAKMIVRQSELLRRAGLHEPTPVRQEEYHGLEEVVVANEFKKAALIEQNKSALAKNPSNTSHHDSLESHLESFIDTLRRDGRIAKDEQTGWLVYDLTADTRVANINVERPFQAASMIKPFVALAYFHRVKEGKLQYGDGARKNLEAMIQHSSNPATNWIMRQVGGPAATQRILRDNYGEIFRTTAIREYIPSGGQTYVNRASPEDYGRFLRALWQQKLPSDQELKRLMSLPGRDRICYGTSVPKETLVINKTGTTAHLCGDMGILVPRGRDGRQYPYAIVGIIEKRNRSNNYGHWKTSRSEVIREVSSLVYAEMRKKYDLL